MQFQSAANSETARGERINWRLGIALCRPVTLSVLAPWCLLRRQRGRSGQGGSGMLIIIIMTMAPIRKIKCMYSAKTHAGSNMAGAVRQAHHAWSLQ